MPEFYFIITIAKWVAALGMIAGAAVVTLAALSVRPEDRNYQATALTVIQSVSEIVVGIWILSIEPSYFNSTLRAAILTVLLCTAVIISTVIKLYTFPVYRAMFHKK